MRTYICGRILQLLLLCTFLNYSRAISNAIESLRKGTSITRLHIKSVIIHRFAITTVDSTISNYQNTSQECLFDVTLPESAFISNFTLIIEGKEYHGVIKDKEVARHEYEKAKKEGKTSGHVYKKPRETNRFKVAISIEAGGHMQFRLMYNELLQRRRGTYDHTIYIRPHQVVEDFRVDVYIQESRPITHLRVPPIRDDVLLNYNSFEQNKIAVIHQPSPTTAHIGYAPSSEDQRLVSQQGLSGLFIVEYDVDRRPDAGEVMVVNGYFVHFFAPSGLTRMQRKILFILDTSGSMTGIKLEQLKAAMLQILDDLREGDSFNIIRFNGEVGKWNDAPSVPATLKNIRRAKTYVSRLRAGGWTNINSALTSGIQDILQDNETQDGVVPTIIFLTDGQPTFGETNLTKILSNIKEINVDSIPVFCLSFGEEADYDFLRKVSAQNYAFARKIYEASDASLQLTGFYEEISAVLASNVTFQYLDDVVIKNTLTNAIFPNYFAGSELVVAGRLSDNNVPNLGLEVQGQSANGVLQMTNTYDTSPALNDQPSTGFTPNTNFTNVVERMWAYITIKQLLEDRLKEKNITKRDEIKKKATDLAMKYKFVTPLTSMIVTKPDTSDAVDLNDEEKGQADKWDRTVPPGAALAGQSISFVDNDPHFIVRIHGLNTSVCFDVMGLPGDVLKLVEDSISGVSVRASIVSNQKREQNRKKRKFESGTLNVSGMKTYIGEVNVTCKYTNMIFNPYNWSVNNVMYTWNNATALTSWKIKLVADGSGNMVAIMLPNRITLLVVRHMRKKSQIRAGKVPFMGFYIVDDRGFSWYTSGILGQFVYRKVTLDRIKIVNGKTRGKLIVSGNTNRKRKLTATLGQRENLATNQKVDCWMVQRNGRKLLDGSYQDYIIRRGGFRNSDDTDEEENRGL